MPAEPALAPAPSAAQSRAALPPPAPILARIARGGPAALEDHESLRFSRGMVFGRSGLVKERRSQSNLTGTRPG